MNKPDSAKVMFEIYREEGYDGRYRVVYFTELNERNREIEINRALSGTHVYDGFISEWRKERAKEVIDTFLERFNAGLTSTTEELQSALEEFLA